MLVPFRKETLAQESFLRQEVQYNLLYRIAEGECATALQAAGGGAVALQSTGRGLWFWIGPAREGEYARAFVEELASTLKASALPSVSAAPEHARLFAEAYSRTTGSSFQLNFHLMAYQCPEVKAVSGVPGEVVRAGLEHAERVAEMYFGFHRDTFRATLDRDKMLADATSMIRYYDLFLWVVGGKTVSMAAIAHRAPRHARINNVFTDAAERKRGYASALVAAVSQRVLDEGRVPVLYANLENPDATGVYGSIGYIQAGPIDEYEFTDINAGGSHG